MHIGLHVSDFTNPGGPATLRDDLVRVVTEAEESGFRSVSVMDHLWQIPPIGDAERAMLEAYTTLGFIAARTERVELLAWVTAVTYREPGVLAKLVTTLDVLSGGRAWLGIGAAWFEQEATGLGCRSPPRPNASSGSRRPCASAGRCGRSRRTPSRGPTTRWAARSTARSRCAGRTRRSSSAAGASARPCASSRSTATRATCSGVTTSPTSSRCSNATATTSAVTTTRSRRPSWTSPTRPTSTGSSRSAEVSPRSA